MFKQKWLIGIITLDGIAIVAIAVYLFLNYSSLNLTLGLVLIGIAGLVMLSVVGIMIYIIRKLTPPKATNKNTLQKS